MDLSLSEDQQLLKDSVAKFVEDNYSIERRRALRDSDDPVDRERWQQLAELGWLGLPFAEADGGYGGTILDTMILMEEFGRGLVPEPYLENILLCGGLLSRAGDAQRARHLPPLIEGKTQWAFGFAEPVGRYNLASVALTAERDGEGYRLTGRKLAVLNGEAAEWLLITARTGGELRDRDGISVFIVAADATGVSRRSYPLVDGTRGADFQFDGVDVPADALLGVENSGLALVEDVVEAALVAIGAESLGAVEALIEQTVQYTRTREQFGKPISRFQALQHRMADMYLHGQSLRSLLLYAAIMRNEGRAESGKAAAALKVKVEEVGRFVSQQAVQLHGGIGMTDELGISHYFKRLLLLNTLFGDGEHHLMKYLKAS